MVVRAAVRVPEMACGLATESSGLGGIEMVRLGLGEKNRMSLLLAAFGQR